MVDRTLEETIVVNARLNVSSTVEDLLERVRSGRVSSATKSNPFSFGDSSSREWTIPGQAFANAVIERGLHRDQLFMDALAEALASTADGAMFGFFSAIDGEGHWEGEPRVGFCAPDGRPAIGGLHDIYFRINLDVPKDD